MNDLRKTFGTFVRSQFLQGVITNRKTDPDPTAWPPQPVLVPWPWSQLCFSRHRFDPEIIHGCSCMCLWTIGNLFLFWNAIIVKSQHETAMQNAARAFMLVLSKSKCCVDICVAFPNACRVTCGAMSRIRPCRVSAPQIVEIIELSSIFRVLLDFCW